MIDRRRAAQIDAAGRYVKKQTRRRQTSRKQIAGSRSECDTTNGRPLINLARPLRSGRRASHALLPLVGLLVVLFVSLGVCNSASSEHAPHPKRSVWVRALGVALPSDEPRDSVERLADRLANWPNQQQATLFYLSLLARNSRSELFQCRHRISLGPLIWPVPSSWSSSVESMVGSRLRLPLPTDSIEGSDKLNYSEESAVKLMARLGADSRFVESAKLALESANLINKLLIHQDSEVIRRISSQKRFFNYLLETKLKSQMTSQYSKIIDALGLVFLSSGNHLAGADDVGWAADLDSEERILFAPVSRQQPYRNSPAKPVIESTDLAQEMNNKSSLWNYHGLEFLQHWTSELSSESIQSSSISGRLLADIEQSSNNNSLTDGLDWLDGRWFWPQLDCGLSNKWILTYSVPFFGLVPQSTKGKNLGLRGVAYVNLDLAKLNLIDQCASQEAPVLFGNTHQCASRLKRSQCIPLPPLASNDGDGLEFRGGNYVCQCLPGSSVEPGQRRAVQRHGDLLTEIVINSPSTSTSTSATDQPLKASGSPLDKLVLEPEDGRLTDKAQLARRLIKRPIHPSGLHDNHNHSSLTSGHPGAGGYLYFLAGAQLDAEAALRLFASATGTTDQQRPASLTTDQPADDSIKFHWPQQICRQCNGRPAGQHLAGSNLNSDTCEHPATADEDNPNQTVGHTSVAIVWPATKLNWFRPLMLALQSICSLTTFCLVGILFRLRKSRVILASGWLMLETILIGALILYASVFVRFFEPTSLTCLLEPWLRELGFSIFYGSILIKLYRILTEFQTRKAHRVCFRDKDQVVYLLAIVLIVIGYMSAWTALMVDGFLFGSQSKSTQARAGQSSSGGPNSNDSTSALSSATVIFLDQQAGQPGAQGLKLTEQTGSSDSSSASAARYLRSLGHSERPYDEQATSAASSSSPSSGMVDQLANLAPEQLRIFARNLDSFGELFSGLLERSELEYEESSESFVVATRCRKLTWDYVTELSELGLLLFGVYLVYKLRNASGDVHKEKLYLCFPIFIELTVSGCTYLLRHTLWRHLSLDLLRALYFIRCQLTVTVSVALIFGPKLWTICKSKPSLFRQVTSSGKLAPNSKASARHRCHLTCEIHDHHLNDAMRLHQAMQSNSVLDIGSIDLADMDPDEIQAELKRVYGQLEILKTKVMRRDNPHISKRRGGRKTSHRKFSLQAFHAHRHTGCQQQPSSAVQPTVQQGSPNPPSQSCRISPSRAAGCETGQKLPVLLESRCEHSSGPPKPQDPLPTAMIGAPAAASQQQHQANHTCGPTDRRVRMESVGSERRPSADDLERQGSSSSSSHLNHGHHHHRHHHHHQQDHNNAHNPQQQPTNRCTNGNASHCGARANQVSAEPNSTSSAGPLYLDDETIMMNDESQSSGNVSPQRRSSFVCSQSSIHPDDSSLT